MPKAEREFSCLFELRRYASSPVEMQSRDAKSGTTVQFSYFELRRYASSQGEMQSGDAVRCQKWNDSLLIGTTKIRSCVVPDMVRAFVNLDYEGTHTIKFRHTKLCDGGVTYYVFVCDMYALAQSFQITHRPSVRDG
ncbi:hypothetical protein BaRGS_00012026 [Batillaria attramentaria]|uniref:Uncharacterized protein n=1 Tax=Batillaria attramentaria TaxID=370345 RepID=A0ABD0LBA0_9CAEN